MTTPFTPSTLLPTDILVALTWIATITGFTPDMVGETLPPDVIPAQGRVKSRPAPWLRTGFVTVFPVGGAPDMYVPRTETVVQVDCWAAVPGSNSPPWHQAEALGQSITVATWQRSGFNRKLVPVVNGVAYPPAMVQAVYMATAFKRLYADSADYARVTGNLGLNWIMPGLTTT